VEEVLPYLVPQVLVPVAQAFLETLLPTHHRSCPLVDLRVVSNQVDLCKEVPKEAPKARNTVPFPWPTALTAVLNLQPPALRRAALLLVALRLPAVPLVLLVPVLLVPEVLVLVLPVLVLLVPVALVALLLLLAPVLVLSARPPTLPTSPPAAKVPTLTMLSRVVPRVPQSLLMPLVRRS